ncbi:MAG: YicC/YloC family endoribonuclease [Nitrospira sp.]
MTGYGRVEGHVKDRSFVLALRSVNHRYCDVVVRLPKQLMLLEDTLKKRLQGAFSRGHIELSVNTFGSPEPEKRLTLDLESAETYYRILKKMKQKLHLPGEIDISLLSRFKEIVAVVEPREEIEPLVQALEKALDRAIISLGKMRRAEGKALAKEFSGRLQTCSSILSQIESCEKRVVSAYHQRLKKRASELSQGLQVDPVRLSQEVALFAERCDISEERSRLKTHLVEFRKMLQKKEAVGRALDFLIQEMNREVNTIGSKANDASISLNVVALKGELEKMREQVQNIE